MNKPPINSDAVRQWWRTAIIDMAPGKIAIRGKPIETLIGNAGFTEMIWLMLRGELPTPAQAALLDIALMAGVDHGPQAPSIAAARMAATCGIGLNNVMATGINMLGDSHGGAGEQCAQLYYVIAERATTMPLSTAVEQALQEYRTSHGKIIPGFGHRFHKPQDPRAPRLMECVRAAAAAGTVSGEFADIGEAVRTAIGAARGKPLAMNIDGATAVIFCELGFAAPLARGLFCLSRAVGILAHGWEQMQQGERNKGPVPPEFLPAHKPLEQAQQAKKEDK